MSTYNSIAWLPLCAGLTGVGLVASWFAMRRRGIYAGLRGVAWSLLPLAAYLTGSIRMFWRIGSAIGTFATSFAFSLQVWSGVAVAGLAALLFFVSGAGRRRRKRAKAATRQPGSAAVGRDGTPAMAAGHNGGTAAGRDGAAKAAQPVSKEVAARPAKPAKRGKGVFDDDDDLAGVEDILRKHGIT